MCHVSEMSERIKYITRFFIYSINIRFFFITLWIFVFYYNCYIYYIYNTYRRMGFLKRYMFFFLSKTINFFIAARRLNSYVSLSKQKGVKKVLYEGSAEVFNHITFPEQIIILFIAFYYPIRLNCTVPLSPPPPCDLSTFRTYFVFFFIRY